MKYSGSVVFILFYVSAVSSQLHSGTVLSVLQNTQGLRMFAQWISDADADHMYNGNEERTVFAFNETVFNNLDSTTRNRLQSMSSSEKEAYVLSYTLANKVQVAQLPNPGQMQSLLGRRLYFIKRNRQYWTSGGTSGLTATYVNGAMISREGITTSNGIVHVLDRVPSPISTKRVYEWLKEPDSNIQTTYFREMLKDIEGDYYSEVVAPLNNDQVTLFLPSQQALNQIPDQKRRSLQGHELAQYIKMHYIPNQVVYTSYVENSEHYQSGMGSNIIFRRFEDKVYVISGGVTAMVEYGNITVSNGVIHIIDRMLGYVYYTAREQIAQDAPKFNAMLGRVQTDLSQLISQSSGMNMFVPLDSAFKPWIDYTSNITLIDMVVRLSMVQDGNVEVSQMTANYDGRQRRKSRYNNWQLVIYNDRNDTWVNGGNVRARITRPDIVVTTGRLQYIDEILGVPSMDIPGVIYYDDYLYRTYLELNMVGMAVYLQDIALKNNPSYISGLPIRDLSNINWNQNNQNQYTTQYPGQTTPYNQYGNNQNNQYGNNQNNQYGNNQNNQYGNTQDQYGNNQGNNQYGNNQYGNNQDQYGNNQGGGAEYPPMNNNYRKCGELLYPCQFTFFVPNGTAIDNYYRTQYGYQIAKDIRRYRFMFRRLTIPNRLIFLNQLQMGQESMKLRTDSGELLTVMRESENLVRIYWKRQSARVIMWDIGAKNGVVHIIDQMLSDPEDTRIDISCATAVSSAVFVLLACLSSLILLLC